MRNLLCFVVLASCFVLAGRSGRAQTDNAWEGTYTFYEAVKGTAGVDYSIVIYRRNNKLVADLDAGGWQTSYSFKCDTRTEGNNIRLYLKGFGEDNFMGIEALYKVGSLLVTLKKSTVDGKTRILTFWGAFKPNYKGNRVNGRVYFKREK